MEEHGFAAWAKKTWAKLKRKESFYAADISACLLGILSPRLLDVWESMTAKRIVFFAVIILEILMLLIPALDCWAAAFRDAAPDDAAEQKARRTVYFHLFFAAALVLLLIWVAASIN